MNRQMYKLLVLAVLLMALSFTTMAQDDDTDTTAPPPATCPTLVQEAFTATELICVEGGTATNQACYGNGIVEAETIEEIEGFSFAQPGEFATVTDLQTLRLRSVNTESGVWAVVYMVIQTRTTNDNSADVTALAFGDVVITNDASVEAEGSVPTLNGTVIGSGGLNVRRDPVSGSTIVWQLTPGETVIITGRTADNAWLRIEIPSQFGGPGWVSARWMELDGPIDNLNYATATSPAPDISPPEFGSMQAFKFQSSQTDETCTDTPDSGILMQTPSGMPDEAKLRVNGAEITFNGAIYLRAQAGSELSVSVLEGTATVTVGEAPQAVPAGAEVLVPLDADLNAIAEVSIPGGYDADTFSNLPIRLLPRQFVVPTSPTTGTDTIQDTGSTTDEGGDTGSVDTTVPTTCTLTLSADAGENKNMRSGPGTGFEITSYMTPGSSITAVARSTDEFNYTWYKSNAGHWIRFDVVQVGEGCGNLPTEQPAPPATAEPNDAAPAAGLISSELGDICSSDVVSTSKTSTGDDLSISMGGNWSATAGTTATFSVVNNLFRGEYGDFIRLVDSAGNTIAASGESRELTVTFDADTIFAVEVVAAKDNTPILRVSCGN